MPRKKSVPPRMTLTSRSLSTHSSAVRLTSRRGPHPRTHAVTSFVARPCFAEAQDAVRKALHTHPVSGQGRRPAGGRTRRGLPARPSVATTESLTSEVPSTRRKALQEQADRLVNLPSTGGPPRHQGGSPMQSQTIHTLPTFGDKPAGSAPSIESRNAGAAKSRARILDDRLLLEHFTEGAAAVVRLAGDAEDIDPVVS